MTQSAQTRTFDLLAGEFYVGDRYADYAWLREHAPLYWDERNELWGVFRYDDIVAIEKRSDVFINSDTTKGGYRPNTPADPSIIGLDDPLHQLRRKLVARRFTPRAVKGWEEHVRDAVRSLLDDALAKRRIDVVGDLAAPLPAQMIGALLGYPHEMWPKLKEWSERSIMAGGGPAYQTEDAVGAVMDFSGACAELYEERKGCPADDVMSVWVKTEADGFEGGEFGLPEVISDCLLLLDGGAETTRTVIARGLLELAQNDEQWRLLQGGADLDRAVEELIRWVTPIHNMCRVATEDVELGGETVRAGQQLVLMYTSANRDEAHFEDPDRLDVTRHPNHHLAFGFGTHFCLGASLARLEIKLMFTELLERVAELRLPPDGQIVETANPFVFGVERADLELVPAS